jgi:hypothetical protein
VTSKATFVETSDAFGVARDAVGLMKAAHLVFDLLLPLSGGMPKRPNLSQSVRTSPIGTSPRRRGLCALSLGGLDAVPEGSELRGNLGERDEDASPRPKKLDMARVENASESTAIDLGGARELGDRVERAQGQRTDARYARCAH